MSDNFCPEILAPAGNLSCLKTAVDFGADAIYCGGKAFGMRSSAKNFSLEDFAEGAAYAHAHNAKVYVTCNSLLKNEEVEDFKGFISDLKDTGIDALIVSDIGVLMMAKELAPGLELHISTQAGVTNYATANSLYALGARRVVLARELDFAAIKEIRANTPDDLAIECFVHGSMCMAFSGRCLISSYLTGRDANHGDCAQPCRWKYHVVEEKRPGQYFPLVEDDEGSYLFNSQDMNMLEHIDDLVEAGIDSLKIEGRAKTNYYVASMALAYSTARDLYLAYRKGPKTSAFELPAWLLAEPYKVAHRGYCTGFYYPEEPAGQLHDSSSYIREWQLVGEVLSWDPTDGGHLTILCRNKILAGQELEILIPDQAPLSFTLPETGICDAWGQPTPEIRAAMQRYSIPCATEIPEGALLRAPMERSLHL